MRIYTVKELAKNTRSIRLNNVQETIRQKSEINKDDYLSFQKENISSKYVTEALRILCSHYIGHDHKVAEILLLKAKQLNLIGGEFFDLVDKFENTLNHKNYEDLDIDAFNIIFKLAAIVVAIGENSSIIKELESPNEITQEHLKIMIRRSKLFYDNLKDPKLNIEANSKNNVIFGNMDCLSNDTLIELNPSPKKNISSRNIRAFLYYYVLFDSQRSIKINTLSVYNPRWNILSSAKIEDIDSEVLNNAKHKVNSLDKLLGQSLAERLL